MKKFGRTAALVLSAVLTVSSVLPAYAAEGTNELKGQFSYTAQDGTVFEKVSHPDTGLEQADGIVDYLGNGQIGEHVSGTSTVGEGDRGQSYSYAAASYGDWVYIGTMYGGLGVSAILSRGFEGMDAATSKAMMDVMYNGNLYTGEPDGMYAGGMLVKYNVKTGESKILLSRDQEHGGIIPTFRSAIKMNNKLYFVGMVLDVTMPGLTRQEIATAIAMQNGFPCIYEVDPANGDKITCVYNCVDLAGFRALVADSVFTSTRAICQYEDTMIAGALDTNGVFLVASKDPSAGQDSFSVIADMNDLFNYPAYHRSDVNGGGGIYQVIEYNNALYVVICTGTAASKNEYGTLKTFAIVKGVCNGDTTDKNAWTWSVLAGDPADGARYPFGLDEERISCGACSLEVYNDYLYIGDYNDVSSALQSLALKKTFKTQRTNLEQSINLYRMDKNENIEKVVGDPTTAFPVSLTGLGSGYTRYDENGVFDDRYGSHMNQYTWQTTVYNGKMYVSTMNTTTLLEPMAQFTNGDLVSMSKEEWISQIGYIRTFLELLLSDDDVSDGDVSGGDVSGSDVSGSNAGYRIALCSGDVDTADAITETKAEEMVEAAEAAAQSHMTGAVVASYAAEDAGSAVTYNIELTQEQKADLVNGLLNGTIQAGMVDQDLAALLDYVNDQLTALTGLLDSDDLESFYAVYADLNDIMDYIETLLPDSIKPLYKLMISVLTKENIEDVLASVKYMKNSKRGFNLFEIVDNGDSVNVNPIVTDGMGDRFNHGLRIFVKTDNYWVLGTANPFYGTQLWRTANLEPTVTPDPTPTPEPTPNPDPTPTPEPTPNPDNGNTGDNGSGSNTTTTVTATSPKTADNFNVVLPGMILVISVIGMAVLAGKRRREF